MRDGDRMKKLVLLASCLGFFVAILRATSVNTALPAIRADLGGGLSGLQWVLNGYTLVFASLLLTAGALSDRLGARRVLLWGLGLFALASGLSALAPTLAVLIPLQALLGVGGALVVPATLALISAAFREPAERARAVGLWSATAGLGVAMGPLLGGLLAGSLGWRSVFGLNVALVVVVAALAVRFVPRSALVPGRGVDLAGQALGILALGSLTYALIEAGGRGWGGTSVLLAFAVFAVCAPAFVLVERRLERRGASPMLPLGLFGNATFSAGTFAGASLTFSVYGQLFLLSLFFGEVLGYGAVATGLAFLPLAFVTFGASVVSGRLVARLGLRTPLVAGLGLAGVGSLLLVLAGEDVSYAALLPNLLLVGAGGGLILPPATAAVVSSAPVERAGIASAIVNASRQASGVLGVALLGSLVAGEGGAAFAEGLRLAGIICALVLLAGAAVSLLYVRAPRKEAASEEAPARAAP
ncbi:MFS transporter [Rubrobacter marinus]|uniref:MFS transporter n=1 Tax=Rubrobacter marinus TaxID=2653852 RepID=A0A6G8PT13_9ACTN|nr:MFS transporter [Rubrobacter marinus]QIN77337.1 MFS transporter [Rubrobacter marinus]